MKRIRASAFVLFAVIAASALAHRAPNSVVRLEFGPQRVRAEVMVPCSELAVALPGDQGEPEFIAYLLRHIAAETPDGIPWRIQVRGVRAASYLEHDYLLADIDLVPPRDASPLSFVLVDDAVTHEVRNHVVWVVSSQGDGLLGALQYPARRLVIERQPAPSPVAHQR